MQLTGGLTHVFRAHRRAPGAAPEPPKPVVIPPHGLNAGSISASSTSVCPGDAVRLHSDASDPQGHSLSYQWSVNGNNQGGTSADYTFTPDSSGDYRIGRSYQRHRERHIRPPVWMQVRYRSMWACTTSPPLAD